MLRYSELLVPGIDCPDIFFVLILQFFLCSSQVGDLAGARLLELRELESEPVRFRIRVHSSLCFFLQRDSDLLILAFFQFVFIKFLAALAKFAVQSLMLALLPVHQHFELPDL